MSRKRNKTESIPAVIPFAGSTSVPSLNAEQMLSIRNKQLACFEAQDAFSLAEASVKRCNGELVNELNTIAKGLGVDERKFGFDLKSLSFVPLAEKPQAPASKAEAATAE